MNAPYPVTRLVQIVVVSLLLGGAAPAAAQTVASPAAPAGKSWSLIDAVGYGGLGFGLGLIAVWDMEGSDFGPPARALAILGATTVAGTAAGAVIGDRARKAIREGRRLERGHRAAVIGGAIMAGGTLGALAAIPLINPDGEGTVLGSDEQTVALLAFAGAALGSVYVWNQRGELGFAHMRLAPALPGHNGYGLDVRIRF